MYQLSHQCCEKQPWRRTVWWNLVTQSRVRWVKQYPGFSAYAYHINRPFRKLNNLRFNQIYIKHTLVLLLCCMSLWACKCESAEQDERKRESIYSCRSKAWSLKSQLKAWTKDSLRCRCVHQQQGMAIWWWLSHPLLCFYLLCSKSTCTIRLSQIRNRTEEYMKYCIWSFWLLGTSSSTELAGPD